MRTKLPELLVLQQTLKNTDRYKTDDLVGIELRILSAQESLLTREVELFESVCAIIAEKRHAVHALAAAIATVDMLLAFAHGAEEHGYTCPSIVDEHVLSVRDGRHPVVERTVAQGSFITNDANLAAPNTHDDTTTFLMITGPNMAGKSTFLRQNALMLIMAQIGSFVPAKTMTCGIFDSVFCRVGASDNLIKGESTFLTEMSETAYILHNASEKSLVVMDEIGRGTSVHDGSAIAQAVTECLLEKNVFTLFATHYHDIARVSHPAMKCKTISVHMQHNGEIVFLHKIVDGIANNSYGIEVAKLAGIPDAVLTRAYAILHDADAQAALHTKNNNANGMRDTHAQDTELERELRIYKEVQRMVRGIEINTITPLSALSILATLREKIISADNKAQ